MEVQYSSILPYLVHQKIEGDKIYCQFKVEHQVFEAQASLKNTKLGAELVSQMVQKAGVGNVRILLQSFLKKNTDLPRREEPSEDLVSYTQEDQESAIKTAFESIQDELIYDKKLSRWRLIKHLSEFETRIKQQPVKESYDRNLMCRMLVEMAKADGRIDENERLFFENFIDNKEGKLAQLIRAVNLTEADCYPLKVQNKAIIYLIVCAVALTDNKLNDKEKEKLDRFAKILNLDTSTKTKLLEIAQDYSLQLFIISKDNQLSPLALETFAKNIDMKRSNIEKTLERLQ